MIQAVGNTTAGVEGVANALNGALAGGGDGGVLSSGTGTSGLAASLTLEVGGDDGSQLLSFDAGTTAAEMSSAINQISDSTGVAASTIGDKLVFNSTDYGSSAFASVKVVNEGTGGTFGSSLDFQLCQRHRHRRDGEQRDRNGRRQYRLLQLADIVVLGGVEPGRPGRG